MFIHFFTRVLQFVHSNNANANNFIWLVSLYLFLFKFVSFSGDYLLIRSFIQEKFSFQCTEKKWEEKQPKNQFGQFFCLFTS